MLIKNVQFVSISVPIKPALFAHMKLGLNGDFTGAMHTVKTLMFGSSFRTNMILIVQPYHFE